jgi:hypothetical protein
MVWAAIALAVAMEISGHRTRSVFERYNIVRDRELKLAAQKQQEYLASQPAGTKTGTIANFSHQKLKRATAN